MEKLTYIITNYNNSKYIEECLQSIVDQENPNWYCLVVDDASSDNSVELIQKHTSEKLKLIKNNYNIGQINSLKNLIDETITDIVCLVDSDDAITSDTTDLVLKAFSTSNEIGFVYSNCIEYDENLSRPVSIGLSQKIPMGPTSSIINGHVGAIFCFRKKFYAQTTGYDTNLLYAEDSDLGYKLEEVCTPYFINKFLYKYRRVNDSRGRNLDNKLIGYKSRKKAKLNAIKRRKMNSMMRQLCKVYVCLEYEKCICSKKNRRLLKQIYSAAMNTVKTIINKIAFKTVAI